MTALLLGVDDGIFQGKLNLADVFFLIATIVFAIAFVLRLMVKPVPVDGLMIAAGFVALALGLLVL
jgi:hypothetical protein